MSQAGDRHAARMDGHHYWRQFTVDWQPSEPGDMLMGRIEALGEVVYRGTPYPKLTIRCADGKSRAVAAFSKALLEGLVALEPVVGDVIKIRFDGEDPPSARGLQPAQRWSIKIRDAVTDNDGHGKPVDPPEAG